MITWCFWLNQKDRSSSGNNSVSALRAVGGRKINSYCDDDYALNAMILNDNFQAIFVIGATTVLPRYSREIGTPRDAETLHSKLRYWLPGKTIRNDSPPEDLTRPLGHISNAVSYGFTRSINAKSFGWEDEAHTDFVFLPLHRVFRWYKEVTSDQ